MSSIHWLEAHEDDLQELDDTSSETEVPSPAGD
jgi:hypothetical protein